MVNFGSEEVAVYFRCVGSPTETTIVPARINKRCGRLDISCCWGRSETFQSLYYCLWYMSINKGIQIPSVKHGEWTWRRVSPFTLLLWFPSSISHQLEGAVYATHERMTGSLTLTMSVGIPAKKGILIYKHKVQIRLSWFSDMKFFSWLMRLDDVSDFLLHKIFLLRYFILSWDVILTMNIGLTPEKDLQCAIPHSDLLSKDRFYREYIIEHSLRI